MGSLLRGLERVLVSSPRFTPDHQGGPFGQPSQVVYVATLGAPKDPPSSGIQDRLPVLQLTLPTAEATPSHRTPPCTRTTLKPPTTTRRAPSCRAGKACSAR